MKYIMMNKPIAKLSKIKVDLSDLRSKSHLHGDFEKIANDTEFTENIRKTNRARASTTMGVMKLQKDQVYLN